MLSADSPLHQRSFDRAYEMQAQYPPVPGQLIIRAIYDPTQADSPYFGSAFRSIKLVVYTEPENFGELQYYNLADIMPEVITPQADLHYDAATASANYGGRVMRFAVSDEDLRAVLQGMQKYYFGRHDLDPQGARRQYNALLMSFARDPHLSPNERHRITELASSL